MTDRAKDLRFWANSGEDTGIAGDNAPTSNKQGKPMTLRTVLLSAAMTIVSASSAGAATVANLGVNPTSSTGIFNSIAGAGGPTPGSGAFSDNILFSLAGGPQFLTIGSATNVYPNASDFITGFTGRVFFTGADGVPGGVGPNADTLVLGPAFAVSCPITPNCQGFAGFAILSLTGNYFLNVTGTGSGTSGYGGNLAVAQVPLPPALGLFAIGLAGISLLRRRKNRAT